MTLSQKDKTTLRENWDQAKSQIVQRFPGVSEAQLGSEPDPEMIAQATGQDRTQVEQRLSEVAKQYSSS